MSIFKFIIFLLIIVSCKNNQGSSQNNLLLRSIKNVCNDPFKECDLSLLIGKKILNLSGNTLNDEYYDISKSDKCKIINLWFSECPPCILEIEVFNRLKTKSFSNEIDFISICKNDVL